MKSEILSEGDYIHDIWKRNSKYADYSIKKITAIPYSNIPVDPNELTIFQKTQKKSIELRKLEEHHKRTNKMAETVQ